jgi:glutathione S-transferase
LTGTLAELDFRCKEQSYDPGPPFEQFAQPAAVVRYERNRVTMLAPGELKRAHPVGKSPVVQDGGRTLAEAGLIVEYLVERYGAHLAPSREDELYWRYRYWLHYAEGSASQLLLKLFVDKLGVLALPVRKIVRDQLKLHLDYLEAEFDPGPWFLGERFTAADIMPSFPVEVARARAGLDETRQRLMGFLRRIHARPAYQRALERGGPYSYAGRR